jgi:hypothetical protein
MDWSFDNDKLDAYPYGISLYTPLGRFKDSFFKDAQRQMYLGIGFETQLINFTFRVKLETRAQELDFFKYAKLACRVGFSNGEDVDLDFHIPYELMIQMATDAGFEIEYYEKRPPVVKNLSGFLGYLNSHSQIPFIYKHRNVNGNNEFFIRAQRLYVYIRPTDINADDGEKEGHLDNNFMVELTCEVRFPAPQMYAYYSNNKHNLQTVYSAFHQPDNAVATFYTFNSLEIPEVNNYGWNKYLYTEYIEEDLNNPLTINFSELFNGDIALVIDESIKTAISPAIFLDIWVINGSQKVYGRMNWETMTWTSEYIPRNEVSGIIIYTDLEYMNNTLLRLNNGDENRLQHAQKPRRDVDIK